MPIKHMKRFTTLFGTNLGGDMLKKCSIRLMLSIVILYILAPILIIRIIYLFKEFQSIEIMQGYLYNNLLLEVYRKNISMELMFIGAFILALLLIVYYLKKCVIK